ncbi:MAG: CDP-alcohol phosphatidyltransferase family protein, partial [Sphingomonas sp.]
MLQVTSASAAGEAKRPLRPRELQDPLNYYLYHPLSWRLAKGLARTPLTPNMVSVIGALFVIAAAVAYSQPGWPGPALLGLALHMTWHVVDGADGDLARMTGRASPIGEMVDGFCDYASHIVLYVMLTWGLSQSGGIWGGAAAWVIATVAGFGHAVQSAHVEVQRRQYQHWVYGTPWIRGSHAGEDSATARHPLGVFVGGYLEIATGITPYALRIDEAYERAQDNPAELARIAEAVRAEAPPLILMCKLLGPNPRAIVLGLS